MIQKIITFLDDVLLAVMAGLSSRIQWPQTSLVMLNTCPQEDRLRGHQLKVLVWGLLYLYICTLEGSVCKTGSMRKGEDVTSQG